MDSLHTTLILPAHARANRAARDPRSTHAAFLRDIAAIVSERSEGARGAVRESGHGFGTLKAGRGARAEAREHREEALEQIEHLSDAALAPRLEALYYLGWAENYLERYDDAIAHAQRGIAIARASDQGRLLVPMMLVQGYPFEMQGRMPEAIAMCETTVEIARLAANPHYLFWALFELGWARYYAGHLETATAACEESLHVGGRLTGGTMPSAGGGPGWALAVCRF
jgi:tetratricopeptide (TPR) repeat protein